MCSILISGSMGRQPLLRVSVTVRNGVKKKDLWWGQLGGAELPKSQGCCCVSCCLASQFSCDLVSWKTSCWTCPMHQCSPRPKLWCDFPQIPFSGTTACLHSSTATCNTTSSTQCVFPSDQPKSYLLQFNPLSTGPAQQRDEDQIAHRCCFWKDI